MSSLNGTALLVFNVLKGIGRIKLYEQGGTSITCLGRGERFFEGTEFLLSRFMKYRVMHIHRGYAK